MNRVQLEGPTTGYMWRAKTPAEADEPARVTGRRAGRPPLARCPTGISSSTSCIVRTRKTRRSTACTTICRVSSWRRLKFNKSSAGHDAISSSLPLLTRKPETSDDSNNCSPGHVMQGCTPHHLRGHWLSAVSRIGEKTTAVRLRRVAKRTRPRTTVAYTNLGSRLTAAPTRPPTPVPAAATYAALAKPR